MNSGAERLGAIRNRDPNRVRRAGSFEPGADAVTQRVWLLLRRPERSRVSRRDDPARRPGSVKTNRARKGDETAGSERARQIPRKLLNWAACKSTSPNCKANAA